jgi:hypothetical protein
MGAACRYIVIVQLKYTVENEHYMYDTCVQTHVVSFLHEREQNATEHELEVAALIWSLCSLAFSLYHKQRDVAQEVFATMLKSHLQRAL